MRYRNSTSKSLFGFIVLALTIVNATSIHLDSIIKIPVTRVPGAKRAKALYNSQLGKRRDTINTYKEDWYFGVYISTSSQRIYKLIVDTASSYTWVGNNPDNPYVPGFASEPTGQRIKISYGNGAISFTGMTHDDIITLDNVLIIDHQSIGVSDRCSVFDTPRDYDGILGLGPTALTTYIGEDGEPIPPIPTVVDSLYNQGTILHAVLGIYLVPYNDWHDGELSFGNYDNTVLASGVNYVPVTNTLPSSYYWGVDGSIIYRGNTILNPTSGIVDTGNGHIKIASDAFSIYLSDTGATLNPDGWHILTQDQYSNLGILSFLIGGQYYDLSPNAQIFPRGSPDEDIILLISEQHQNSESDPQPDFTLGYPFLERYYVVFNTSSSQIGFASTHYTHSTSN